MKKILFVLVVSSFLFSCSKPPLKEDLNRENQTLQIQFVSFKTEKEMIDVLRDKGFDVPDNLLGFSVWSPQDNDCTVYHVTPKFVDDQRMKTIGHEVSHCLYGSFH